MSSNEAKFIAAYKIRLAQAIEKHPEHYQWPEDVTIELVVDRMVVAIKRNRFANTPAIKAAAKDCGVVPQTMQNIVDFVCGRLEPINVNS